MNTKSRTVTITTDYITLGQLLKFAYIIGNGAEARFFLATHDVLVNGTSELRRGRKLYPGDKVLLEDEELVIAK